MAFSLDIQRPNEPVEKHVSNSRIRAVSFSALEFLSINYFRLSQGHGREARLARSLPLRRHRMGDFFDVVYHGEQFPLCIDFGLAAQGKARHPFVLEVGEDRLDNGDTLIIDRAAKRRVELAFHPFDGFVFEFLSST